MAAKLVETLASQPGTERGKGILIDGHSPSRTIAYCNGKSVILRNVDDPRVSDVYKDHSYPCTVARISPNGEWVVSGDSSGTVRVWARRGEHALKYESKALAGSIQDLAWSADGQRIVVCGDGKQQYVRAFMWDSGGNMGDFDGHSKCVLSCSFRPKRPFRVFSCGEDYSVNFYEGPPFRLKQACKEHANFVNCVRYSPDGNRALTVASDKKGIIFDGQTGAKLGELSAQGLHKGSIYAASWSPDSKHVVTVSADKTAKVWRIADDGSSGDMVATFAFSAKGVQQLEGPNASSTGTVDFMQVGCLWLNDTIITVSLNGDITLIPSSSISSTSPASPKFLQGHMKYVTALAITEADGELYSASYDGRVVRWSGGNGEGVGTAVEGQPHTSIPAIACVDGQLVTVGLDDTMRLTPLPATSFSSSQPPVPLGAQPKSLAVAQGNTAGEGPFLLVATVKGLSLFRGSSLLSSHGLPFEPSAAAISPDAKQAAVGSAADGIIRLFNVQVSSRGLAFTESGTLERHRGPISALEYSPDGEYLASADGNREVVVWETATGEAKLKNLVYHNARVSCLAWSPDSKKVATGSLDMSIIVYEMGKAASERLTIKGAHTGGLSALLFKGPGTLVSAGLDACLRVWDLE